MPIWFVYRSPYHGPMSKYVKRLDGADTLLDWFRSVWRAIPDGDYGAEAGAYAEELLGTHVYSFGHLFVHASDNALPRPANVDQLHQHLESALYVGGEYRGSDDTIQVLTDDDELSLAMYWFTDEFAKARPERVAYLLREDWRLPEAVGSGGFTPKPGVRQTVLGRRTKKGLYLVDQTWETASDLEERDGCEMIPNLRLPNLVPWLLRRSVEETEEMGNGLLCALREELEPILGSGDGIEAAFRAALKDRPNDRATWNAYTDWLADQDRPCAELHLLELALRACGYAEDLLQVAPHCVARMQQRDGDDTVCEQLFLFDDVWASGNVDLANALLDYHGRFNVLDDWDVPPGEGREPE